MDNYDWNRIFRLLSGMAVLVLLLAAVYVLAYWARSAWEWWK